MSMTTVTTTQIGTADPAGIPMSVIVPAKPEFTKPTAAVPPSPPGSARVFNAEPASTLPSSTRVLITTLVIFASLTQVSIGMS